MENTIITATAETAVAEVSKNVFQRALEAGANAVSAHPVGAAITGTVAVLGLGYGAYRGGKALKAKLAERRAVKAAHAQLDATKAASDKPAADDQK